MMKHEPCCMTLKKTNEVRVYRNGKLDRKALVYLLLLIGSSRKAGYDDYI
jgi:hypothetical protein